MAQKYRIYINDNTLLITDKNTVLLTDFQEINVDNFIFKDFYHSILSLRNAKFQIRVENSTAFLNQIINSVKYIEAAGGLVKNANQAYLFIYRNGKWDLPKGKLEEGEQTGVAACREVEEECGVKVDTLGQLICETLHAYVMFGDLIIKRTYWYNMQVDSVPVLTPQTEEGISDVRWVEKSDIEGKMQNTFPSIIDVLNFEVFKLQ